MAARKNSSMSEAGDKLKDAAKALDAYARAQERILRAQERALALVERNQRLEERVEMARERALRAQERAQRTQESATARQYPVGPFQQLERLQGALTRARDGGAGGARLQDLEYLVGRAQQRVNRITAPPPAMLQRVAQYALESRLFLGSGGGGVGVMLPQIAGLIGRGGAAAGGAGGAGGAGAAALMANPYVAAAVIIAGAAAATARALYGLADGAAQSGAALTALRNQTGSSSTDAARLAIYSRVAGADLGAMAGGLNDRINSDPLARAFAARFGATSIPGPYGTLDTGQNLIKVVEGLRGVKDPRERLRIARALGVEGALPLTMVGEETMSRLRTDASIQGFLRDPEFERRAAEFNAAKERASGATDSLKDALGKTVMPLFTSILNGYADSAYGLVAILTGQAFGLGGGAAAPGGMGGAGYNPLDANTDALTANTIALARLTGMIGGGERARGALPPGLKGAALVQAREFGALRFGTL